MNIRFTSSLTPEDENFVAPGLLRALTGILDLLPIAYVIRIDTTDSKVYEQSGGIGGALPVVGELQPKNESSPHAVSRARSDHTALVRHRQS
jgi:hypothetical protein